MFIIMKNGEGGAGMSEDDSVKILNGDKCLKFRHPCIPMGVSDFSRFCTHSDLLSDTLRRASLNGLHFLKIARFTYKKNSSFA